MKAKIFHYILGIVASIALILTLLITSFEIAAYSDYGWYEKEYLKYEVLDDLEMEIEDAMYVTEEMMAYLRGNRENLVVDTIVDGKEREFFNDREKAHMVDVQNLFLGGMDLRLGAVTVFVMALVVLAFTKADWKKILPKSFLIGVSSFIAVVAILGGFIATDFNKYFVMFHHLFFNNDLWILDPYTDLLIRMLPEGFFFDMVIRIGVIFIIALALLLCISVVTLPSIIAEFAFLKPILTELLTVLPVAISSKTLLLILSCFSSRASAKEVKVSSIAKAP